MNSKELEERLINFAVLIITIAENLKGRSGFILSSQIIRSGTSCEKRKVPNQLLILFTNVRLY
jgi:hypothetical protein